MFQVEPSIVVSRRVFVAQTTGAYKVSSRRTRITFNVQGCVSTKRLTSGGHSEGLKVAASREKRAARDLIRQGDGSRPSRIGRMSVDRQDSGRLLMTQRGPFAPKGRALRTADTVDATDRR